MTYVRRKTRKVRVGDLFVGGDSPISVQSMTNTDTRDIDATVKQIHQLERANCDIVRIAVPDMEACKNISTIKEKTSIPIIADIHFDYRLALEAADQGIDGIRINPGNIGSKDRVKKVVDKCREKNIAIRIGVNGGSLEKDLLEKYGSACPEALVESAMKNIEMLEEFDFFDIVVSLKSSDVLKSIEAYRMLSEKVDYPIHLGITEAGGIRKGTIKSSIGIGAILAMGIGDTLRVSLTGDPVEEIFVGKEILRSLDLLNDRIKIISCPSCGRCNIDLIDVAGEVEKRIENMEKNITVAIMGCAVNGPGEAREANIGIAGGKDAAILFKNGEIVRKLQKNEMVESLVKEIEKL